MRERYTTSWIPRPKGRGLIEGPRVPPTAQPRPRFRGRKVAASLKAGARLASAGAVHGFRGRKVAASLKVGVRPAALHAVPRFRGRKVAASLKRARTPNLRPWPPMIPRPKGRGLIEAGQCADLPEPLVGFRGRKVAASLKRPSARRCRRHPLRIPRPKGRGLIEARGHHRCPPLRGAIPRPKGRGLIEASRVAEARCPARSIPRPKGRGLIEAAPRLARGGTASRRFRGRKVAASLKPTPAHCYLPRPGGIPRPKGRGLIEA